MCGARRCCSNCYAIAPAAPPLACTETSKCVVRQVVADLGNHALLCPCPVRRLFEEGREGGSFTHSNNTQSPIVERPGQQTGSH